LQYDPQIMVLQRTQKTDRIEWWWWESVEMLRK
jgi:hypothetical protein